jgi:hypothetical protein
MQPGGAERVSHGQNIGRHEMEEAAKFAFVGMAAVSFFAFLTISHWISTVAGERRDRDRLALLKKAAEQPPETAERLRLLLQEEDARTEARLRRRAIGERREGIQGGLVVLAVGVGLGIFLRSVVPDRPVWTLGIMLVLIGLVITSVAMFGSPTEDPDGDHGS